MELPKRKPNRLSDFDYNTPGAYFITICVEGKQCILANIVGGGAFDAPQTRLTPLGRIVEKHIVFGNRIQNVCVDKYVIMPNHIHLLLMITEPNGPLRASAPTNAVIPHFVSTFKRFCRKDIWKTNLPAFLSRSYYSQRTRLSEDLGIY